jgi:hypothetical protein
MISNRGKVKVAAGALAGLLALAGCSSSSSSAPSWASALGSNVTVVAPETVAPGNDSPGAVMTGFIDDIDAKKYASLCSYMPPSTQSKCTSVFGLVNPSQIAAKMPFAKKPGLGYIAIDGKEALIGTTGEFCQPGESPECYDNSNAAAILDSGKSFSVLWKTAVAETNSSSGSNTYDLSPCLEVGGKWYADISLG